MEISYTWEEILGNKYQKLRNILRILQMSRDKRQVTICALGGLRSSAPNPHPRQCTSKTGDAAILPDGSGWQRDAAGMAGSVDDVAINCGRDNAFYRLTLDRIRCFATFARTGGGASATPLGRRRALRNRPAGSSRRVLAIGGIIFGQYLTQLWQVKGQIFGNSMLFQLYESISAKLSIVAA